MKHLLILLLLLLTLAGCTRPGADGQKSVTIHGQVTDYKGYPIDSCSIIWQSPSFGVVKETITDKEGRYTAQIPKGKYQSVVAIHMPSYASIAMQQGQLAEEDYRLEFWAWNFIADRDTTFNIRYHRMEVYGLHAYRIPGAMPCYQIYVRPMSLTRTLEWMKLPQNQKEEVHQMAPRPEQLGVKVWIDGEEVPILMKQEIRECLSPTESTNAYLLTVDFPKHSPKNLSYRIFKVELTDLENGDRGEGLYYMPLTDYVSDNKNE